MHVSVRDARERSYAFPLTLTDCICRRNPSRITKKVKNISRSESRVNRGRFRAGVLTMVGKRRLRTVAVDPPCF